MEFRNLTPFDALCFSALDKQDVEHPVIVMKVGYRLLPIADRPGHFSAQVMDDEPLQLCTADRYWGEEGQSSVCEESDLAPFKPRCDVIVNGHAHAPGAIPAQTWVAGIRLSIPLAPLVIKVARPKPWRPGEPLTEQQLYQWRDALREAERRRATAPTRDVLLDKRLRFHGPRSFVHGLFSGWRLTEAEPASCVPLRWEYAFGGASVLLNPRYPHEAAEPCLLNQVCYGNPLGRGWIEKRHEKLAWSLDAPIERLPAPQIESADQPITHLDITRQADGDITSARMAELSASYRYQPAGFGTLARMWAPRLALAGTYDEAWQAERWPGLPTDFDFGYWNGAPADQQIAFAQPDLRIELFNLTDPALSHNGQVCVELPGHRPFVLMRLHNGVMLPLPLLTDTLLIDTDAMTVSVTHRISLPSCDPVRVLEARFETDPAAPLLKRAPAPLQTRQEAH
ncbi:MAG: DUF2169 family type VI secretion system accessory protein [Pseudomonas sp.]